VGEEEVVLGPYKLLEQLNVGRLAELYLATKPGEAGFEKKVVIKRLLPGLETDEPSKASFIHEAKLAAKLIHPRIAQTFELASQGHELYVAMEHVDGVALDTLARRLAARGRRLEPQLAVWIAHQMLDALDFAHQAKVVHGELQPSKVLISFGGDVKVVGFGALPATAGDETWRDVFAAGVVLAELLTGHRLFAGANDLRVMRLKLERFERSLVEVEAGLADIVRRALRTATDIRWDAAGFRDALGEWMFEHRHRVTNQHLAAIVSRIDNLDALPEIQVARGPAPEVRAPVEVRAIGTGAMAPVVPPPAKSKRPSIEIPAIKLPTKRAPSAPSTTEIDFDDIGEPAEAASLAPAQGDPDEFGDLALAPALSLVWKRLTSRSTGKLVIALPAVKREIYFTEGRPESTASNIASEQLGNYLVASGALTTGELSLVLATREHRGGELDELLIDLGLVESRELRRHWSELTRDSIVDTLTWKKGAYEWYPGAAPKSPMVRFDGNPYELLGVAALRLDERLVVPTSKAQLDRRLQAAQVRVDPSSFGLSDLPTLLAAVDGKNSVDDIARNQPDRLRAYRILYLLEACELVHEVRRDHA
jgi:hypothetical protein